MTSDHDIVFVGPYPPIRGGISQHSSQLVTALESIGRHVEVVSWRNQYPRILYPGEQAATHLFGATHFLRWWSPLSWLKGRHKVKRARIVVFPWVTPVHSIPLKVMIAGAPGTVVAVVHNARPHESFPFARGATRWALRSTDGIVAHSQAVGEQVVSLLDSMIVEVVPHPPNLDLRPTPLPPAPVRLLFLGFIRDYKGVDLLIDALGLLRAQGRDYQTTVAGEAWQDPRELQDRARSKGVADLIDWRLGYVPDDEVGSLLEEHHIVVQPYKSASQSGVVPIALAAGRPVVVTPVGGLAESVDHGGNGVISRGTAPLDIADAIDQAVGQLDAMSSLAKESRHTWLDVAKAVLEVAERGKNHETAPDNTQ